MVMLWAFTFSPIIKVQWKIAKQNAKKLILEIYGDTEVHPFSHLNHYGRKGRKGTIIAKDRILTGVFATIALKARKKHSWGAASFFSPARDMEKHGWYFDCNNWDLWLAMFSCIEISVPLPDFPGKFGQTWPAACQVVLAFLPTALYLIIRNLMSVKSSSEAQPGEPRKVGIYDEKSCPNRLDSD